MKINISQLFLTQVLFQNVFRLDSISQAVEKRGRLDNMIRPYQFSCHFFRMSVIQAIRFSAQ